MASVSSGDAHTRGNSSRDLPSCVDVWQGTNAGAAAVAPAVEKTPSGAKPPAAAARGPATAADSSPSRLLRFPWRRQQLTYSGREEAQVYKSPPSKDAKSCQSDFDKRYVRGAFIGKGSTGHVFYVRPRSAQPPAGQSSQPNGPNVEEGTPAGPAWMACKEISFRRHAASAAGLKVTVENAARELEIMKDMRHPNLVELHDYIIDDDSCRLVMPFLSGGDLSLVVADQGSLAEEDAKDIIRGVLRGVQHMHANGFVHRDLKLENLMLVDKLSNHLKIVDLGMAKKLYMCQDDEALRENTVCGSPMYMAPEVATPTTEAPDGRAFAQYGLAADLWSCGVILYLVLSGYPPFDTNKGIYHLFRQIRSGDYSLTSDPAWVMVSDEAKDLVRRLLTVDPGKRITSTEALQHPWIVS